jgi:hypothetical protein
MARVIKTVPNYVNRRVLYDSKLGAVVVKVTSRSYLISALTQNDIFCNDTRIALTTGLQRVRTSA